MLVVIAIGEISPQKLALTEYSTSVMEPLRIILSSQSNFPWYSCTSECYVNRRDDANGLPFALRHRVTQSLDFISISPCKRILPQSCAKTITADVIADRHTAVERPISIDVHVTYAIVTSIRDHSSECCSMYALDLLPLASRRGRIRARTRCIARLVANGCTFCASLVRLSSAVEGGGLTFSSLKTQPLKI